jgi:hypothetical protein
MKQLIPGVGRMNLDEIDVARGTRKSPESTQNEAAEAMYFD